MGDLSNIGLRNTLAAPSVGSPNIPDLLFAAYQCMFAAITYVDSWPDLAYTSFAGRREANMPIQSCASCRCCR